MSWGAIVVGVIGAGVTMWNQHKNRQKSEEMYQDALGIQRDQEAKLDKQKQEYKRMTFKNPFAGMENPYEDLTINQKQANFLAEQGQQQRANIMQSLKGAAGASGIAGLAQALANQGALQTQRISASIGLQESANQRAAAKGALAVDTAQRQGRQWVQQANMDRQATLLGMQMGQTTGANLAATQAQTNQINAMIAQQQSTADMFGTLSMAAGGLGSGQKNEPESPWTVSGVDSPPLDPQYQSPAGEWINGQFQPF